MRIICPKTIPMPIIRLRFKKYFKVKGHKWSYYKKDEYFAFVDYKCIVVDLFNESDKNLKEIENMIDFIFRDKYVGIENKYAKLLTPKAVKVFPI